MFAPSQMPGWGCDIFRFTPGGKNYGILWTLIIGLVVWASPSSSCRARSGWDHRNDVSGVAGALLAGFLDGLRMV